MALREPGGVWGGALFTGLTRPGVIRDCLESTWGLEDIVAGRANWQFSTFPTGALLYFEMPQDFFRAYDQFVAGA